MSVIATIMLLPMKITSATGLNPNDFVAEYGIPTPPVKRVFPIWDILKIVIIPIILIIGSIIYFKKSKRKTYEKVIIMIVTLVVVVIIGLIIYNYLIN